MKIGTIVRCIKSVYFADGTKDVKGDLITITESNFSYFQHKCNAVNYRVV